MKTVIYWLMTILCVGSLPAVAQHCNERQIYLNIIAYLKNDTSLYSSGPVIKKKRFSVAPYFIKTNFEFTCNFFQLPVAARDTACNWEQKMDKDANQNYKEVNSPVLSSLPYQKDARFVVSFAKQYKNLIYCQIVPLTPKEAVNKQQSGLSHMGATEVYSFTMDDCRIVNVKKGKYYIQ